jgi:hypothetical protein
LPDLVSPAPPQAAALPIQVLLPPRRPTPPAPPAPVQPKALPTTPTETIPPPPKPVIRETTPQPLRDNPRPGPSASDRAKAAGISDLANELSSLRDSAAASKAITGRPDMLTPPSPNATAEFAGGADTGPGSERSLITAQAGRSSGGINTAGLSRGTGGGALAGRGTTLVAGYGGGGTGTGPGYGNGRGTVSGKKPAFFLRSC